MRAGCLTLIALCLMTFSFLWPFLTVLWVGLQCVIVILPDHPNLLFQLWINNILKIKYTKIVLAVVNYRK